MNADESIHLQDALLNLKRTNVIETSHLIRTFSCFQKYEYSYIVNHIFNILRIRPRKLTILAELCNEFKEIPQFKAEIVELCFNFSDYDQNNIISHIYMFKLLHSLYESSFISNKEIVDRIMELSNEHDVLKNIIFLAFSWFAPEIEMLNHEMYLSLKNQFKEYSNQMDCPPILQQFAEKIDIYSKDNWQSYQRTIQIGESLETIAYIIINDDVDQLQKLSSETGFDVNERIEPSIFRYMYYAQFKPTLIEFSIIYKSLKIFKFLMLNGVDMSLRDDHDRSVAHFAIASGNEEIIRLLSQEKLDFSGALHVAAAYHRQAVFTWLHDTMFPDLNQESWGLDGVIHQCSQFNNINLLNYCLKNGVSPNENFGNGVPLSYAAMNNQVDIVKILLSHPDISVDERDNNNNTPLMVAVLNSSIDVVKLLIKDGRSDVNASDWKGMTSLHYCARFGNVKILRILLSHGKIQITRSDKSKRLPIHIAAHYGNWKIIEELVQNSDVDLNAKTNVFRLIILMFVIYLLDSFNVCIDVKSSKSSRNSY